ncbi:MAG: AAA family ATPase, partial [Victivallales bacterium]|nr:AAA family ATPase [Victivallales bacterium]
LGGLDNLKDCLTRREKMFTREALAAGVPIPKGLLIMGVSGCGKSLAVKTISSLWNIPMFRLDMNLVFSGMYGTPEAAFHRAMTTVEAVAPAVLWID